MMIIIMLVMLNISRQDIIEALAEATERGVIIVTCTQCSSGAVGAIEELIKDKNKQVWFGFAELNANEKP